MSQTVSTAKTIDEIKEIEMYEALNLEIPESLKEKTSKEYSLSDIINILLNKTLVIEIRIK